MPCPAPPHLEAFAQSRLPPEEAAQVRGHAEGCPTCRTTIARVSIGLPTAELGADPSTMTPVTAPQGPQVIEDLIRRSNADLLHKSDLVGRYMIVDRLGAGGMGVVYSAYDPELHRKVALKLLRGDELSTAQETSMGHARLLREAQAVAQLTHENVVTIYDVGTFKDRVFIALELVEGTTLKGWLREAPRPWQKVLAAFIAAGRGLAAAHAVGLVHRDFKPDNVLIGHDGRIRVTDFGLARRAGAADEAELSATRTHAASDSTGILDSPITQSGIVIGTPPYMGPEQFGGSPADARTDQFAFCVALHEGLYGERPFQGKGKELVDAIKRGVVRPAPRDARVPQWLRRIVLRGLSVDPAQRWGSMDELLAALGDDPAVRRRRIALSVAVPLVLLGAVYGTWQASRQQGELCAAAGGELAGVWDDAARGRIEQAFGATGVPYAPSAFAAVDVALTEYARGWSAASVDACQAARLRGEQSEQIHTLRVACLAGRRGELQALTELFATADAKIVERAVSATQSLSRLERCSDVPWLLARVKPPEDPKTQRGVAEVSAKLARGKALIDSGKYKDALPVVGEATDAARALGYRPAVAEARQRLAHARYLAGEFKAAKETAEGALVDALATGQDDLAAEATTSLVAIENKLVQYESAHRWAAITYAELDRLGAQGEELRARFEVDYALLFYTEGRYEDALEHAQRAVALTGRAGEGKGLASAFALTMIARAHDRLGDYGRSLDAFGRALSVYEATVGAEHPQVAGILTAMAPAYRALGQVEKATAVLQRAVAINQRTLGPAHPATAASTLEYSAALRDAGRPQESLDAVNAALPVATRALGAEHPLVEYAHRAIGYSLTQLGRPAEALEAFARAEAIAKKVRAPDHAAWTFLWTGIGEAQLGLKQYARAQEILERSLQRRESGKFGLDDVGENRFLLAQVLWARGTHRARAIQLAAQAEQDYAKLGNQRQATKIAGWRAARSP